MKALAQPEVHEICRPLVVGDAARLREAGRIAGVGLAVDALRTAAEARFPSAGVQCVDLALVPDGLTFGRVSPVAGEAAYRYIEKAVDIAPAGLAPAICTAPLPHAPLHAARRHSPPQPQTPPHLPPTHD